MACLFTLTSVCTRTPHTLCVPNTKFDKTFTHELVLSPHDDLAATIMAKLEQGLVFALYQRRYYPNTSDQCVATATLPLSQLRSFLTTAANARPGTVVSQRWQLSLRALANDGSASPVGTLDVALAHRSRVFQPPLEWARQLKRRLDQPQASASLLHPVPHIRVKVAVIRTTGLLTALTALNRHLRRRELSTAVETGAHLYVRVALAAPVMSDEADDLAGRASQWQLSGVSDRGFAPEFDFDTVLEGDASEVLVELWLAAQGHTGRDDVLLGRARADIRGLQSGNAGMARIWVPVQAPKMLRTESSLSSWSTVAAVELGVEVLQHTGSSSAAKVVIDDQAWLGAACQLQIVVEEALLPSRIVASDGDSQWLDQSNQAFYVRYSLPDGRSQRSTLSYAERQPHNAGLICNIQHRGVFTFHMTPTAVASLCRQLELQLWVSASTTEGEAPVDDARDQWLGSCYLDTHALLTGKFSVTRLLPLIKPHSRAMSAARMRVHVLLDMISDAHFEDEQSSAVNSTARSTEPLLHEPAPLDAIPMTVVVERALHLIVGHGTLAPTQSTYVSYMSGNAMVCTQLVQGGSSPEWQHERRVDVGFVVAQPTGNHLQFRVWLRDDNLENAGEQLQGIADVDLEPLQYGLPLLSGWYHLRLPSGREVGQLFVTIKPHQPVPRASGSSSTRSVTMRVPQPLDTARPTNGAVQAIPASAASTASQRGPTTFARPSDIAAGPSQELSTSFLKRKLRDDLGELETLRTTLSDRLRSLQEGDNVPVRSSHRPVLQQPSSPIASAMLLQGPVPSQRHVSFAADTVAWAEAPSATLSPPAEAAFAASSFASAPAPPSEGQHEDALARAKQLLARMNQHSPSNDEQAAPVATPLSSRRHASAETEVRDRPALMMPSLAAGITNSHDPAWTDSSEDNEPADMQELDGVTGPHLTRLEQSLDSAVSTPLSLSPPTPRRSPERSAAVARHHSPSFDLFRHDVTMAAEHSVVFEPDQELSRTPSATLPAMQHQATSPLPTALDSTFVLPSYAIEHELEFDVHGERRTAEVESGDKTTARVAAAATVPAAARRPAAPPHILRLSDEVRILFKGYVCVYSLYSLAQEARRVAAIFAKRM